MLSWPRNQEPENKWAVILYHGITGTPDEMSDLAQYLYDRGFDVFVPCLSGHTTSISELRKISSKTWKNEAQSIFSQINDGRYQGIFLAGLSFGALLSLYVACLFPAKVSGIALLSLPLKLHSTKDQLLLQCLSFLPDCLLNLLGVKPKQKRAEDIFIKERQAYSSHSIAALARVFQVRRFVLANLRRISSRILVLQDPRDHHLSVDVPLILRRNAPQVSVEQQWFPGGQHELTLGHSNRAVFSAVDDFFRSVIQEKNP